MKNIYLVSVKTVIKDTKDNYKSFEMLLRSKEISGNGELRSNYILEKVKELYKPTIPVQYLEIKEIIKIKKVGEYEGK
jgi:hypothetical protein